MFIAPDVLAEGVDGDVVVVAAEHVLQGQVSARRTTFYKLSSNLGRHVAFSFRYLPNVFIVLLYLFSCMIVCYLREACGMRGTYEVY